MDKGPDHRDKGPKEAIIRGIVTSRPLKERGLLFTGPHQGVEGVHG